MQLRNVHANGNLFRSEAYKKTIEKLNWQAATEYSEVSRTIFIDKANLDNTCAPRVLNDC